MTTENNKSIADLYADYEASLSSTTAHKGTTSECLAIIDSIFEAFPDQKEFLFSAVTKTCDVKTGKKTYNILRTAFKSKNRRYDLIDHDGRLFISRHSVNVANIPSLVSTNSTVSTDNTSTIKDIASPTASKSKPFSRKAKTV